MNKIIILSLLLSLSLFFKVNAQEKVFLKQDVGKFAINKNYYKGKKVKDLLKDLKLDIQLLIIGGGTSEENNFVAIRFIDSTNNPDINAKSAKMTLFIKERDEQTNKLFLNDSSFKRIKRDNVKYKSNEDLLRVYENLTILDIDASSEKN